MTYLTSFGDDWGSADWTILSVAPGTTGIALASRIWHMLSVHLWKVRPLACGVKNKQTNNNPDLFTHNVSCHHWFWWKSSSPCTLPFTDCTNPYFQPNPSTLSYPLLLSSQFSNLPKQHSNVPESNLSTIICEHKIIMWMEL